MRRRMFRSLSLLLFFASFILLACDLGSLTAGKPTVIISSPPHGSQFREGDDVAFQSTATDSSGVTRVELVVDGVVVRTDSAPGPQGQPSLTLVQTWKATQGTHAVSVRAYNASSTASDPASISITVSSAPPMPTPVTPPISLPPTVAPPTSAAAATSPSAGSCTDNAAFVADVTVPDGTAFAPGQTFNKTWRVRNSGTCTWGAGYLLAFIAGEAMGSTTTIAVPNTAPGANADLLVAMTAPTTPGGHAGQWRLKNSSGALFGTTMSVSINVTSPGAPPPPPPPAPSGCTGTPSIASFTATSTSITAGSSTTLQWGAVTGADSVDIDQGIGGVAAPGNTTVSPGSTTTYTMTAHCGSNVATKQVTITVTGAPAAGTCKPGFVYRDASPTDKVCVPPASHTQALADNAAAASRKLLEYGPDTCIVGYVWREAWSGDHVCVTGATRTQVAADNSVAASRWVVGPYGAHTCISGFVWRAARTSPLDDVCVTGAQRDQAAADNAAAASRVQTAPYGPDTCKTGYVWREAWSGDHVCVTGAVRTQVAADNAAAPSHTY